MATWFVRFLENAQRARGLRTQRQLAEFLQEPRENVTRWLSGSVPEMTKLESVVRKLGGDLERCMPGWAPDSPGSAAPLHIAGRVAAGVASFAVQELREIEGTTEVWKASTYRPLTMGPVVYLEVWGDSMEPHYPDGCLLACARPARRELPPLVPVIARIGDMATFKLYRLTRDRRGAPEVELLPINLASHEIQRYDPRDVLIDYVVLGFLNPWKHGIQERRPQSLILRELKVAEDSPPYGG